MIELNKDLAAHGIGSSGSAVAGKQKIAAAIVTMGQSAAQTDSYDTLATKIKAISSDATVVPSQVLSGQTFYAGSKKTGTLADVTQNITPGTADVPIMAGFHNGSGKVTGDPDLVSANIKAGINLFGVNGSSNVVDTADANLDPAFLLTGYSGYDDGVKKSGTMPNVTQNLTPGVGNVTIPAGYHAGTGVVSGDADLVAGNIKKDVNIFGVVGTYVGDYGPGVLMPIDPIWEKYQDTPTYNTFNNVFESASDGVLYLIQPAYHTFARVDRAALGKQVWVVDYGSGSTVKWAISPSGEMYGFVHQANDAKYLRVYQKSNGNAYIAFSDPAFFATLGGSFAVFSNGDVLITYYDGKVYRLSISSALGTVWSTVMPSFSAGCSILVDGSDNFYLYGDDMIYKFNSSGVQLWGESFPSSLSGHSGSAAFLDPVSGNPTMLYDGFGVFQTSKSDGSLVYQVMPSGSNWATPLFDASGNMFAQQQSTKLWERWNAQKTKKLNSKILESDTFYYNSKFSAFDHTVYQTNSFTNRLFIHATTGV